MNKNCQNYCRNAKSPTLIFYTLSLDFSGSEMPDFSNAGTPGSQVCGEKKLHKDMLQLRNGSCSRACFVSQLDWKCIFSFEN